MNFAEGEVLLVNKPLHWTSFDVVNKIRYALKRNYGKLKVGHAGTLDPLATGLLIICTGRFTKRLDEYQAQEKEYTGTLLLGATTPSLDSETPIDATYPTDHITQDMVHAAASSFIGDIEQIPPIYSAIKVEGKVAHRAARSGQDIELKPRPVHIREFEITHIELPEVSFRVVCSKGTYIRSLVRDLGTTLQSGAYMTGLCRTRSGEYQVANAWELPALIEYINAQKPTQG
jgi:tRNA pseudouridine55 synthase